MEEKPNRFYKVTVIIFLTSICWIVIILAVVFYRRWMGLWFPPSRSLSRSGGDFSIPSVYSKF